MKRTLLLLLLFGVAVPPASAVIDPFYRNRMESGLQAFEQGNWDAAAHQLRIACFGHLDEPVTLVGGLVRLAIVEVRRGDEESFQRVFSRLLDLEEKFSAYSKARLPQGLREQFEALAAQLVPAETLRATRGFDTVAERADVQRIATLPPNERRAQLEERRQAEPGRADWPLELARLELSQRRPAAALDWLDQVPAHAADIPPTTCLRQQAASEVGDCPRMDLTAAFCRDVPPMVVEFRLQCLVEAARWPEAARLVATLDPELRSRRRIARLERRVRDNFTGTVDEGELADVEDASAEAQAEQAPADVAAEPPADLLKVDELRRRLAVAESLDELTALAGEAEELASRHSDSRPAHLLAAEIAYLRSDWATAVDHFDRVGPLRTEEAQLAFYQAVALYESGDPTAAAEVLRPVAWRLESSAFVDSYVERILSPGI